MRLSIALIFLINAYFLNAIPIDSGVGGGVVSENPCSQEGLYSLKYYYPYEKDETKYIECNPWNGMEIKSCPEGSKWNTWLSACIVPQAGVESPEMPSVENSTVPPVPFCSFYGNYSCQNGGVCNQFFSESRCFCLSNVTGEYCEVTGKSSGAFGQLINETFSLDLYKRQRPLVNDSLSFNTSFDTSLILDAATKQRVQKYLDLYPNGEMRFDTLINYLVQDFLSQLFPSAFFLREFTLESEIQMGYSNAIPNLLQSAKYGFDKYENFFLIFEEVLDNLVDYLPRYMPKVREEAQTFFEVYDMIFTRFSSLDNSTVIDDEVKDRLENRTELTRDEIKHKIFEDFNTTLVYSYDLFRYLNRFDDELSVRGENFTTEEMQWAIGNFSLDAETTRLLSEIHMTSTQMWDSLSFYGFWYVISKYVTIPEVDAKIVGQQRPFTVGERRPVAGALMGGEEEEDGEGESSFGQLVGETTILPGVRKLVAESTTISPSVARLLPDTTVVPRLDKLVGESTFIPSRLVGETTVVPSIRKLVGETTISPSVARLLPDTTILPKIGKLVGETTVMPSVSKLFGETTIVPSVDRLFGDSTVIPSRLVGETTVMPSRLVGESTIIPSRLVGETTVVPSVSRLVGETTIVPSVDRLFGETTVMPSRLVGETTVVPSVSRLVGETTVVPRLDKLVGDSTIIPSRLFGESTVIPSRLVGETTVMPSRLVGETTVMPSRLFGETTVVPRLDKLVGDSTIIPSRLFGESTVIPSRLVGETTVMPSRLVGETTVMPLKLVGETTPSIRI